MILRYVEVPDGAEFARNAASFCFNIPEIFPKNAVLALLAANFSANPMQPLLQALRKDACFVLQGTLNPQP